jgi:hypothetical protein
MANLASRYSDLGKYTEAEKLEIQAMYVSSNILGGEHPDAIRAMKNLAAIQKAMRQSMKVDNAANQVFNISHRVLVIPNMEGENVKTGVPYPNNRVLEEDASDAAGAPAHLPSTTNVNDTMIHSQNKHI